MLLLVYELTFLVMVTIFFYSIQSVFLPSFRLSLYNIPNPRIQDPGFSLDIHTVVVLVEIL